MTTKKQSPGRACFHNMQLPEEQHAHLLLFCKNGTSDAGHRLHGFLVHGSVVALHGLCVLPPLLHEGSGHASLAGRTIRSLCLEQPGP